MQNKLAEEELNDVIQWDVQNWKNALPYWSAHFDIKAGMKVLALGEREGGLSLYFAKKGCEVICSDYNDFPEETKQMHARYSVEVSYHQVDMRNIPFDSDSFDVVAFKSVIGALGNKEDQNQAIAEIARVLKPGGAFLFAENATGSGLHKFLRKKFINWSHRWRYIDAADIRYWSTAFSEVHVKTYGFFGLFGRSEKQRRLFGRFDRLFNILTPRGWRYIYFGVMIK